MKNLPVEEERQSPLAALQLCRVHTHSNFSITRSRNSRAAPAETVNFGVEARKAHPHVLRSI
ncbi:hypothetical protein [Rhizobium skierniewicense]|uniref:hypothetical protein n=1 Tax=Rhizobium skierniewicense TaxID=984260 RepID=UPI001573D388|nr:hypothetical protein [Rhizobium skierniewicense]NTF33943.1 hypothetical protein [Rhizobium skierniewicense]